MKRWQKMLFDEILKVDKLRLVDLNDINMAFEFGGQCGNILREIVDDE